MTPKPDQGREDCSVFLLRVKARPGAAGIHQLRALLKALLRRHGFRCLDAREIREPRQ
jgi:hypothetical protein